MNPNPPASRENKFLPQWLRYGLAVGLFAIVLLLLLSRDSISKTQRIVVLATWSSNGEQMVTFRLEPPNSEVSWAELVPVSDDGTVPPPTLRTPWGDIVPASLGTAKNSTIRYDALPFPGASIGGRPVACTPGSYTVAYTPTASANRLGAGLALEARGPADWVRRCRKCWLQKSFGLLRFKTHQDPVYVTSTPITNVIAAVPNPN